MHTHTRRFLFLFIALIAAVALAGVLVLWVVHPDVDVTKEGVKLALEKLTSKPVVLQNVRIGFFAHDFFSILPSRVSP